MRLLQIPWRVSDRGGVQQSGCFGAAGLLGSPELRYRLEYHPLMQSYQQKSDPMSNELVTVATFNAVSMLLNLPLLALRLVALFCLGGLFQSPATRR
jgi:hypothetical protein